MFPQRRADDSVVLTPAVLHGLPIDAGGDGDGGKDGRGTILVIGGTTSTPGAVVLAGVAALRAGAGRLQLAVPAGVATQVAVAVPESACFALPATTAGEVDPAAADALKSKLASVDVVLIGPGLTGIETVPKLVEQLLSHLTGGQLVVIDAKAVQALRPEMTAHLRGRLVMTPNPQEAAVLLGDDSIVETAPLEATRQLAKTFRASVALRGATTWIAGRDHAAYRNEAGNNGLGTSGSGDSCAGLVAGFAARGADPVAALAWAVYTHARAGDRLAARVGRIGFLAREIADEVPAVLTELDSG
jgi:hydroxyethylthiazole kinase-like uncharacterized protein yjeF